MDLYVLERSFTSAHASCGPLVRPAPGQRRQLHAVLGVCGTAKLSSFSSSKDLVPSVGCCECCGGRRGCRPGLAGCLFVKVDVLTPLWWPPAAKCLALCAQHMWRARRPCATARAQFDDVLASYRQHSRLWCPTLNKFAEGAPWPCHVGRVGRVVGRPFQSIALLLRAMLHSHDLGTEKHVSVSAGRAAWASRCAL